MASGLRVRSAVDDPSGYAIAENLHSKVAGLQQSVTNVQTANNLLAVADGALNSIQLITQRIRSLIVEANSDINSSTDLANIQVEINQLLLEINKIGANTQFNGLNLFNGQFDNGSGVSPIPVGVSQVTPPSGGSSSVSNPFGSGPGPFVTLVGSGITGKGFFTPSYVVFSILANSYSPNQIDPDSGTAVGPGVLFQIQAYSSDPLFGAAPFYTDTSALPVGLGPLNDITFTVPGSFGSSNPSYPSIILNVNIGNVTQADGVNGATIAFLSTNGSPPVSTTGAGGQPVNHALTVNDGGDEGKIVSIDIPTVNTAQLGISDLSVLAPTQVNYLNQVVGQATSNQIAATASEQAVDTALEQISAIRAQIGAQTVALGQDAQNDDTAIVNYSASESNIRDLNVGQTVTDFTKQQILVSVGNAVLSQLQVSTQQLTALLLNSYAGLGSAAGGG